MIRVLVVDDSALMRKIMSDMLSSDPSIKVVGTAANGRIALEVLKAHEVDVITLDLEMPEMDGIETLKAIMASKPLPVIIVSATSQEGTKRTLEAMALGAAEFVAKPSGEISLNLKSIASELINKVKVVASTEIKNLVTTLDVKKEAAPLKVKFNPTRKKIIVIGTSTGGPQTLEALLTEIPGNLPCPILIVQHMPPVFTKSLADRLDKLCHIRVREAKEGDELKNGVALIAPGGFHMELKAEYMGFEGVIRLNQEPPELGVRPNANRLFKSVANIFKENTIGVVLTGMGNDGTEGCRTIKKFQGTVLAQAEESCVIFGMPKEVIAAGLADEVIPLDKLAVALAQLVEL